MPLPKLPGGFSWAENIALGTPEVYRLSQLSWPRFLLEESDIPDPLLKFEITLAEFKEKFKVFGIRHDSSATLVAFLQAVHVAIDSEATELPDLGWRFSLQNASQRSPKNALSLVEASIDPEFRGSGLSKLLIERAKIEASLHNFSRVIAPVRPSQKANFPDESIEAYCVRKDPGGRVFDPWLRTHLAAGAVLNNVCHNSVCVKASLPRWRAWTGLPMLTGGPTHVDGALMPVLIDLSTNAATYVEPNVWVTYAL